MEVDGCRGGVRRLKRGPNLALGPKKARLHSLKEGPGRGDAISGARLEGRACLVCLDDPRGLIKNLSQPGGGLELEGLAGGRDPQGGCPSPKDKPGSKAAYFSPAGSWGTSATRDMALRLWKRSGKEGGLRHRSGSK